MNEITECTNCQKWDSEDGINPYWMDCTKEYCPKFKIEFDKLHHDTKQQVDILLRVRPERI